MRTLYGTVVPDSARLVEVRAIVSTRQRPRTIFRGPLEDSGYVLTEDMIADTVADDAKFWAWVATQSQRRHLQADRLGDDGTVLRCKLSISFINQDGSFAILDPVHNTTTVTTQETWEFHKTCASESIDPMRLVDKFSNALIEQQKEMPNMMARMLKDVIDANKLAMQETAKMLQQSAIESAKIIQQSAIEAAKITAAASEPIKTSFTLVDQAYKHESTRADKAADAVIRILNAETKSKEDDSIDQVSRIVTAGAGILTLLEKSKKVL